MLRDFKADRHPGLQAVLFSLKVYLFVVFLACVWEFGLESEFAAFASPAHHVELLRNHAEYVATISSFTLVALIAPTFTLYRYIVRRDEAAHQALHLATHDTLTDLPNRSLLFDRIEQAIAHARRHDENFAVVFIDLDGFKSVNDGLGHDAGDHMLRTTAKRLKDTLRETDTVARFGGDEFVALITEVKKPSEIKTVSGKLKAVISMATAFEGQSLSVGASVGCALYPNHGGTADELIVHADKAMYADKNAIQRPMLSSIF